MEFRWNEQKKITKKNKFVVSAERSLTNFDIEFIGESNNFLYPINFAEAD